MKKFGINSPSDLKSDEEKKKFFNYVDANYKAKKKQIEVTLISVKVYKGNVERALSKLKKKVKEEKLFLELKQREFYTKPSALKREKKAKSKLRIKKLLQN